MPLKIVALGFIVFTLAGYAAGKMLRAEEASTTVDRVAAGPGYSEALPSVGPADAAVVVIEMVDYNCDACRRNSTLMKRLMIEHTDVLFVRKHLPLGIWPSSAAAAAATLAAGRQGGFWRFQDQLFLNQRKTWDRNAFIGYAKAAGLDADQFAKDLEDPALLAHVEADKAAFAALNQRTATPTIFVNGTAINLDGTHPDAAHYRKLINKNKRKVAELLASGKFKSVYAARNTVAAQNHPAGDTFVRYFMDNDVSDLSVASE